VKMSSIFEKLITLTRRHCNTNVWFVRKTWN